MNEIKGSVQDTNYLRKNTHYCNVYLPVRTLKKINDYKYMLLESGLIRTVDTIGINAMMRGFQEIETVDMQKRNFPTGLSLKKRIYEIRGSLAIQIQNLILEYPSAIEVAIMDKYRVVIEHGLDLLISDIQKKNV